jgi:ligand-binding SRPBCC domain-containing protein
VKHRLRRTCWLPQPRATVFAWFANPENLGAITPPELGLRILDPSPEAIAAGRVLNYRLRLHGLPFHWRTLISVWEPTERFVDEQIEGPYRRWVHTHRFRDEAGGTRMDDRVDYELPFGPCGELGAWVVGMLLRRIFDYRGTVIRELLPR